MTENDEIRGEDIKEFQFFRTTDDNLYMKGRDNIFYLFKVGYIRECTHFLKGYYKIKKVYDNHHLVDFNGFTY